MAVLKLCDQAYVPVSPVLLNFELMVQVQAVCQEGVAKTLKLLTFYKCSENRWPAREGRSYKCPPCSEFWALPVGHQQTHVGGCLRAKIHKRLDIIDCAAYGGACFWEVCKEENCDVSLFLL